MTQRFNLFDDLECRVDILSNEPRDHERVQHQQRAKKRSGPPCRCGAEAEAEVDRKRPEQSTSSLNLSRGKLEATSSSTLAFNDGGSTRSTGKRPTYNFVVLGAGGVGKSALILRFIKHKFVEVYDPTIEEAYRRVVEVDGCLSQLEVLDTAGVEQFAALNEVYIQNGMGFVLVFSLTQEASLREVDLIRQQIYRIKGISAKIPIVVVGTKSDLTAEREVHRSTVQRLAKSWELPFYETSAKKDWHVSDVFHDLVRQMRARYPAQEKSSKRHHMKNCIIM